MVYYLQLLGGEGKIRQAIVEDNLVERIIALPTQLFCTTGIPVMVIK